MTADRLVVLLHGVGADGFDLIDLAPVWAEALPNALFIAPHAPFPFPRIARGSNRRAARSRRRRNNQRSAELTADTRNLKQQIRLAADDDKVLEVARQMYARRFPDAELAGKSLNQWDEDFLSRAAG